jgi:aspartyl-tRNA(Asn)/glutamyl-tRNA(Gln) amidotransferase subunit C
LNGCVCYTTRTMAKLTEEDVLKLARLAKLELTDDEVKKFADEMNEILAYVEQLQSVDVSGLEPTYQVTGLSNVMRSDVIKDYGISREELLKNLPAQEGGQIKVKRVLA